MSEVATITLDAKVDSLRRVETYPERPSLVEARETHMSWVFLTDRHAYKLKKPVRYGVLDYHTLGQRRCNCENEVTLNRRLAPDVYLDVIALTVDERGQLTLGGKGTIVEWLVKMRRLSDEHTLEQRIRAGRLHELQIEAIAHRLAWFFGNAETVTVAPRCYRARFNETVAAVSAALSRRIYGLDPDRISSPGRLLLDFIANHGELLEMRAREKRIRDGHGDLRPEHIYLNGEPKIIDCLEFDATLRRLDPIEELAFLALECERLGEHRAGLWLFRAYTKLSGDHPPWSLIEFYAGVRAFVRACTAIWHLDDPAPQDAEKWIARTYEYLQLADEHAKNSLAQS